MFGGIGPVACRLCQYLDQRNSFAELDLVKSQKFGLISQKLLELRLGQRLVVLGAQSPPQKLQDCGSVL